MSNPITSALPAIKKAIIGIASKKAVIGMAALVIIAGAGVGSYFLFFRGGMEAETQGGVTGGGAQEVTAAIVEHDEPKPEKKEEHKEAPKKEDHKAAPKEGHKEQTSNAPMSSTAVTLTVGDEDNWKLDTPIDALNFNDPKDLDKARRKIARDIKIENKKALAELKGSTAEEKERKERSAAIEAWLEKGTRQDAIQ